MENCLDRTTMQDLLDEIGPALKDIAARNGVTISCGRARFNALSGTIELEIAPAKTDDFDPEQERWNQFIKLTKLLPEDFRSHVVINGMDLVITGINPKARTNKIILLSSTGKEYVTSVDSVERALKRNRPAQLAEDLERKAAFRLGAIGLGLKIKYGDILDMPDGKSYRLVDINMKAPKYPILAEDLRTGKMVKMPADIIESGTIRKSDT